MSTYKLTPFDTGGEWLACEYPERPAEPGIRFHLREQDTCRACAVAWQVARQFGEPSPDRDVLDQRAQRVLAGRP
jgi:hypothetical protein